MTPTVSQSQHDETTDLTGNQSLEKLRPVMIRQLLDATRDHSEATFKIDGHEVGRFSLVVHVIEVCSYETSILYKLEDGTGSINARHPTGSVCEGLPGNGLGDYVFVIGALDQKVKPGNRNIIRILHMHKVTDISDQLFSHILETAFVTLRFQRGAPPAAALRNVEPRIPGELAAPILRRTEQGVHSEPRTPVKVTRAVPEMPQRAIQTATPRLATPVPSRPSAPSTPASWPLTLVASARPDTPAAQERPPSPSPPPRSPAPESRSSPPPVSVRERAQGPSKSKRRKPGIKKDPFADLTVLHRAILLQLMNAPLSEEGTHVNAIYRAVNHHDCTPQEFSVAIDQLVALGHIESAFDQTHYIVKTARYPTSP